MDNLSFTLHIHHFSYADKIKEQYLKAEYLGNKPLGDKIDADNR